MTEKRTDERTAPRSRSYDPGSAERSHVGRGRRHRPSGYAELEVDAKVELIRSLVPLGLMHILLDVTALAGERYARKAPSVGGRCLEKRSGWPERCRSKCPDSPGPDAIPLLVRGAGDAADLL